VSGFPDPRAAAGAAAPGPRAAPRAVPQKTPEETLAFAAAVAAHQGWELNPDTELRDMVLRGLRTNHNRYGFFMCPCRDSDGDPVKDKDIRCPCAYAKPDITEHGQCYCGLYLAPGFSAAGRRAESIPERRPQ
jgi:ferredoxin-thioredoxin reductase catalytic subunit